MEQGLRDVPHYPEFIDAFQMDLIQFFVVATEEMKSRCQNQLAEHLIAEEIRANDDYNEFAVFNGLTEKKIWELAVHYDLGIVVDGPGEKSIEDINNLRNRLVHDPGEFASDPPPVTELIAYINSTLDIIEELEEQDEAEATES